MVGNERGKHEWLIEFVKEPNDFQRFSVLLDENLRNVNSDYDAKRSNNMVLEFPIILKVKSGTFDAWLKEKGKLGGQNKVPRLSNSREYVEEILNLKH